MKKAIALALAAAVAAGSFAAATGSASADPYPPQHWKKKAPWHGPRPYGGWVGPFLFGSMLGYGVGTYYGSAPYYGSGYDAHVAWCLDRYRTYNPRTNMYFLKRGVPAVCHSPFG